MATSFSSGGQSGTSHHRTVERVFEDAQHTGEINLSGRKLREYPKISPKYDLSDTSAADLSKNRLSEVPQEICEYHSLERLNCYHNVIKSLPEALTQLHNLTHLCISRNQLTVIPIFIKHLQALEVLIASHNKLVSLPEEIGDLKRLMEIDVSCNEISHLPMQIGDLKSLRSLNVRRNLLIELPVEISKLNLRRLDFSSNKIATIPTIFRKMETLEEFILDHNPLTLPPAYVCTKGKQHIMKYLQIEAIKEDRKRGIMNETEMKRLVRKSLPPQNSISEEFRNMMIESTSPENKWNKRHTVLSSDSGYSTTDSIEKCGWSPSEAVTSIGDLDDRVTNRMAVMSRDQHMNVRESESPRRAPESRPPPLNTAYTENTDHQSVNPLTPKTPTPGQYQNYPESLSQNGMQLSQFPHQDPYQEPVNNRVTHSSTSSSSPLSPQTPVTPKFFIGQSQGTKEDEFTRELQRQKNEYDRKKKHAEQLRLQQEEDDKENRRRAAQRIQEDQQALLDKQREELRLLEEARLQEEQRQREEARLREEQRVKEEEKQREEARLAEEQRQREDTKRQVESKNPAPNSQSSTKDDKKPSHNTQYRRTASDSSKKAASTNAATSRTTPAKHGAMNGKSPTPSPRSSVGSTGPSPASSTSSLHKAGNVTSGVTRRSKVTDRVASVQSASSPRSTPGSERPGRTMSSSSTGSQPGARTPTSSSSSATKKNHLTPEEEFRQKHQSVKNSQLINNDKLGVGRVEDRLKQTSKEPVNNFIARRSGSSTSEEEKKRPLTSASRTTNYNSRRSGTVMSSSTMKVIDSYKDADPNYTLRRQEERYKEEADQIDRLRKTIESRLKVVLPENLPETLRDGVLLCQLANNVRPRAVTSIHVPSPAVPKLTMAKCRKNVENFLEACRKIGVGREQICSAQDILEEKGISRVSVTIATLIAITTGPKGSAV